MFIASCINNPFEDPGVYVEFKYRREALLFDLGDIHALPPRKILKVHHIFISHTHMDHFVGFDHLLRICLGRDVHIALFGPPGFIRNVESKIGGYTWNLVENYTNDFVLHVAELHENRRIQRHYTCRNAFRPETGGSTDSFTGTAVDRDDFTVTCAFLDHKIPSLAYALEEKKRLNIKRNALDDLNLPVGPWLTEFKHILLQGAPDSTPFRVWWRGKSGTIKEQTYPLGVLRDSIVKITPGKKITYVADAMYSDANARKIIELAQGSEILFIEAPFLAQDAVMARRKYHLTAQQAGMLAREAGVSHLELFHFSPKYKGSGHLLVEEAIQAFTA